MKLPLKPPSFSEILEFLDTQTPVDRTESDESPPNKAISISRLAKVLNAGVSPEPEGKYRHWDILRHLQPPNDLTVEEWWAGIKFARVLRHLTLPLTAKDGAPFNYVITDDMHRMLHGIDKNASGAIQGNDLVTNPQTRATYIIKSLMEEAITSSQLEGATTTREVAKDMIRSGRKPRDVSERMIFNNYHAMSFIREIKNEPLTPSIVFELHKILTEGTLRDPTAAGRFRRDDEDIIIDDGTGVVLHRPPPATQLAKRLEEMCKFANASDKAPFVHPVVRAIFLHFWLAYDHPFVDGNGRTARALFYWLMANQGYWLCEFISISRILKKAPSKYAKSFLYTETDENDATYFILNQLKVITRAIRDLHDYLTRKSEELYAMRQFLQTSNKLHDILNYRQLALLHHAMKNPYHSYSVESHRGSHKVSYQTARTDLLELSTLGLLDQSKVGRAFIFSSPPDLKARTERIIPRGRKKSL